MIYNIDTPVAEVIKEFYRITDILSARHPYVSVTFKEPLEIVPPNLSRIQIKVKFNAEIYLEGRWEYNDRGRTWLDLTLDRDGQRVSEFEAAIKYARHLFSLKLKLHDEILPLLDIHGLQYRAKEHHGYCHFNLYYPVHRPKDPALRELKLSVFRATEEACKEKNLAYCEVDDEVFLAGEFVDWDKQGRWIYPNVAKTENDNGESYD